MHTLAKTEDLNSDNDGTVTLTNVFDPEYNRGPADYDVRHTFSSNWIYELPCRTGVWRLAGERNPLPPVRAAAHGVGHDAVDRHHEQPAGHDRRSDS